MSKACLIVQHGRGIDRFNLGDDAFSIGRHPGNKLCLNDDRMSRRHCVIERRGMEYVLIDLASRNGVKVNGERITEKTALKPGDILKIGSIVMQFAVQTVSVEEDKRADLLVAESIAKTHPQDDDTTDPIDRSGTGGAADFVETQVDQPVVTEPVDLNLEQAFLELNRVSNTLPPQRFTVDDITLHTTRGGELGRIDGGSDASGMRLMRLVLMLCIQTRATDVHLEPVDRHFSLRLRVDGVMISMAQLEADVGKRLLNVAKVLCELDITQKVMIQEGHFGARVVARSIDYRVSFTPVMRGQKLVVRVLDLANAPSRVRDLMMPEWMEKIIRKTIRRDAGMILTAGPTGSGKTTTLYAIIREINANERNIITIEDPVEYHIPGVTQIPIDASQGNTFTTLLRAVLRQDPDVILLGEIRDVESARIAMQAAATGHLVLASIHSKDVIGALYRLMDLGVDSQLIASAINVVVAQRLVRRLCPDCKRETHPTASQRLALGEEATKLKSVYQPIGCVKCLKTGYLGRISVFEMLEANTDLRDTLITSPTTQDLRKAMDATLFHTLRENAFRLAATGETSLEEIQRVAGGD